MGQENDVKIKLQQWLSDVFKNEINNISVDVHGSSEKGDGYMGDILYATVKGIAKNLEPKEFSVVLKCSKESVELRKKVPVQHAFLNEIVVYDVILPGFRKFELSRGIKDAFESTPRFYGRYTSEYNELIVLENLKASGYDLCNRMLPMPRKYVQKVLREYAKFHAISVAMQDQEIENFELLSDQMVDINQKFVNICDLDKLFGTSVNEVCDLLQGVLDDSVIGKWRNLKKHVSYIITELYRDVSTLKTVIHGDCWCNNFMFKNSPANFRNLDVTIIDWQFARIGSPLLDVSYFLFCAISKEDLPSLNDLLEEYYDTLINRLKQLGSDPKAYSKNAFFADFKKYCLFALLQINITMKISLSKSKEAPDIMDTVDKDMDISDTFNHNMSNTDAFKNRMSYIVEYAVQEGLLDNLK